MKPTKPLSIMTVLLVLCFATACETTKERAQQLEVATVCEVIKLEPEGSNALTEPVCMVECIFRKGTTIGLGTSTPVPCEGWLNKKVIRK